MIRDKRTLALMMIAPLIILTLVHFLFTNDSTKKMTIGVTNMDPSFIQQLKKNDIQIKKYTSLNEKTLINEDLDGMIQMDHNHATLLLKNADPSSAKALQMKIQQLFTLEMKMKQQMKYLMLRYRARINILMYMEIKIRAFLMY